MLGLMPTKAKVNMSLLEIELIPRIAAREEEYKFHTNWSLKELMCRHEHPCQILSRGHEEDVDMV